MPKTIELPEDLAAFAQARVDTGDYGSFADVVRDAFGLLQQQGRKVERLRKELDIGIAELDAGHGTSGAPSELMAEIRAEAGLPHNH